MSTMSNSSKFSAKFSKRFVSSSNCSSVHPDLQALSTDAAATCECGNVSTVLSGGTVHFVDVDTDGHVQEQVLCEEVAQGVRAA